MTTLLRLWWRQPCHYLWLSAHLQARGLQPVIRKLVAVITASLGILPTALLASSRGPHGGLGLTVAVLVTVSCVVSALLWTLWWPTRDQAAAYCVLSTLCVAAACLVEVDPLGALMTCVAFAAVGGFIAFYLTARYLAFNLLVATATASLEAVRLAMEGQPAQAVCKWVLIVITIVAVPFTAQLLMHLLGADAINSDLDPLTGLANRRALPRLIGDLLAQPHRLSRHHCIAAAVIDLDDFKRINDTLGHAAGDRALHDIGAALRQVSGAAAIVARTGGEEFLIIDIYPPGSAEFVAERYRRAVSGSAFRITASVGIASAAAPPEDRSGADVVESLIHLADTAMYDAKRAGGNQVRHTPYRGTTPAA